MKLMQQLQLFGKNKNVGGKAQSPCSARRADFGRKRPGCGMRYNASATALIALTVLCLTSCSVSRKASSSERLLRTEATTRDTVWQQVVVAVHDAFREVNFWQHRWDESSQFDTACRNKLPSVESKRGCCKKVARRSLGESRW